MIGVFAVCFASMCERGSSVSVVGRRWNGAQGGLFVGAVSCDFAWLRGVVSGVVVWGGQQCLDVGFVTRVATEVDLLCGSGRCATWASWTSVAFVTICEMQAT